MSPYHKLEKGVSMLKFFLALLLGFGLLSAMSIDEQIRQLKAASPQERFELMNALKERIAAMNEEQRQEALKSLKTQMKSANGSKGLQGQNRVSSGTMQRQNRMQGQQTTNAGNGAHNGRQ